jgi:hypothetical protein
MSEITYTNDEIFRAFKNRTYEGSNHVDSLTLKELPDGTFALLGYNWCKLADISKNGEITIYSEWGEWAQARFEQESNHGGEATTKRHIRELRSYLEQSDIEFTESFRMPSAGSPPAQIVQLGHLNMIPNRTSNETEDGRL